MAPPEIWPPLLTPFDERGALDLPALGPMVDFYADRGCTGLLVNGLSAEPFETTSEERAAVLRAVIAANNRRMQIAAAIYPDGGDWPGAVAEVHEAGADIAVLLVPLLVEQDDDDAHLLGTLRDVAARTSGPLGLYEAPRPYKRILSTDALSWAGHSGRFTFFKDTCQDFDRISERLRAIHGTPLRLLNAEVATYRRSVVDGAHGFCGLMANVFPEALQNAGTAGSGTGELVSDLLTLADPALEKDYPASAKCLLGARFGLPLGSHARTLGRGPDLRVCNALDALYKLLDQRGLIDGTRKELPD